MLKGRGTGRAPGKDGIPLQDDPQTPSTTSSSIGSRRPLRDRVDRREWRVPPSLSATTDDPTANPRPDVRRRNAGPRRTIPAAPPRPGGHRAARRGRGQLAGRATVAKKLRLYARRRDCSLLDRQPVGIGDRSFIPIPPAPGPAPRLSQDRSFPKRGDAVPAADRRSKLLSSIPADEFITRLTAIARLGVSRSTQ